MQPFDDESSVSNTNPSAAAGDEPVHVRLSITAAGNGARLSITVQSTAERLAERLAECLAQLEKCQQERDEALEQLKQEKSIIVSEGQIEHVKGSSDHMPMPSKSWTHFWRTNCTTVDRPLPDYCPCVNRTDTPGVQHKLKNPVGAHVIFRDDKDRLYVGIVPVCNSCNRSGHPLSYECVAVTVVDAGAQTVYGKLVYGEGRLILGSDLGTSARPIEQVHRPVSTELTVDAVNKNGKSMSHTYTHECLDYLEEVARLGMGGLAICSERLNRTAHVPKLAYLNNGIFGIAQAKAVGAGEAAQHVRGGGGAGGEGTSTCSVTPAAGE